MIIVIVKSLKPPFPVRNGGLGIRRVASLALSAFLALAAKTLDLQALILTRGSTIADQSVVALSALWSSTHNLPCPSQPSASKQLSWDAPCIASDSDSILVWCSIIHHRARLLAVTASHAGDWLHVLPISN